MHALRLDEFWYTLRTDGTQTPGQHRLLRPEHRSLPPSPTLLEAKKLYLELKGSNRPRTFQNAVDRAVTYLTASAGNKPLLAYHKSDATRFRDALYARKLSTSSVERTLTTVKAIVGFAFSENGIEATNPFSGLYLNRDTAPEDRKPIPLERLSKIQAECRLVDDELRWLLALISDTGMRLAEVVGLETKDIRPLAAIPNVIVRPNAWRGLKTKASERAVPLVGHALWASQRILESQASTMAFSRYTKSGIANANSASASLNKWLKSRVPSGCVVHSFRHSLRDRLRAVECPSDIVDQIGGWTTSGEGQSYGEGYPLEVTASWMHRMINGQPRSKSSTVEA